jgi:hypothetical protein
MYSSAYTHERKIKMDTYELNLVITNLQEAITDIEKALVRSAKVTNQTRIVYEPIEKLLRKARSEHDRLAFILYTTRRE